MHGVVLPRDAGWAGAEPPGKDEPYLSAQIWCGYPFGRGPGNQKRVKLAYGEGVPRTLSGKTKVEGKEARPETRPAEQDKDWYFARGKG